MKGGRRIMKKINWNKVGWRTLQALTINIFNGATWFWIVANFVGNQEVDLGKYKIDVSYFDLLSWWQHGLVYLFMVIGVLLTFGFVKLLYRNHREDKQLEKQAQVQENQSKVLLENIQKIVEGKKK